MFCACVSLAYVTCLGLRGTVRMCAGSEKQPATRAGSRAPDALLAAPPRGQCITLVHAKMRTDISLQSAEAGFVEQSEMVTVLEVVPQNGKHRAKIQTSSGSIGWISSTTKKNKKWVQVLEPASMAPGGMPPEPEPQLEPGPAVSQLNDGSLGMLGHTSSGNRAGQNTTRSDFDADANPVAPQGESMYG